MMLRPRVVAGWLSLLGGLFMEALLAVIVLGLASLGIVMALDAIEAFFD